MLISAFLIFGLIAFFLLRDGYQPKDGAILIAVAVILLSGWLFLRPQQGSVDKLEQFEAELGQGRIMLLEMQSPF